MESALTLESRQLESRSFININLSSYVLYLVERSLDLCNVQVCDEEIEDDFSPEETGPTYFAGPWTGCSVICGDGIKTREVTK